MLPGFDSDSRVSLCENNLTARTFYAFEMRGRYLRYEKPNINCMHVTILNYIVWNTRMVVFDLLH